MTRDELKAELIAAIQTVRPTDATPVPSEVLAESVLFVIAEHVWSGIVHQSPDPDGGTEWVQEFQTWRGRSDDLFVRLMNAQAFAAVAYDLDRCEHGRHEGDACISCAGGVSLGNPVMAVADAADDPAMAPWVRLPQNAPLRTIGFDVSANPIVVPEADKIMSDPAAWRTR